MSGKAHTAFTYAIYRYSLVAVAKKTPEWFNMPTQNTWLWGWSLCGQERLAVKPIAISLLHRLADCLKSAFTAGGKGEPFPKGGELREGIPVTSARVGRRRQLGAASLLLETVSKFRDAELLPDVTDITWSWRWSGFQVLNLCVGRLARCIWNIRFSSSDSSYLTWHMYPKCALTGVCCFSQDAMKCWRIW